MTHAQILQELMMEKGNGTGGQTPNGQRKKNTMKPDEGGKGDKAQYRNPGSSQ